MLNELWPHVQDLSPETSPDVAFLQDAHGRVLDGEALTSQDVISIRRIYSSSTVIRGKSRV